mmetsp:Transcript_12959/g.42732  ORF Transcript_12959/g.42732 Transcript_12959/m.42732 type:complete len:236 (-) Transcript_12959:572-1279(-)
MRGSGTSGTGTRCALQRSGSVRRRSSATQPQMGRSRRLSFASRQGTTQRRSKCSHLWSSWTTAQLRRAQPGARRRHSVPSSSACGPMECAASKAIYAPKRSLYSKSSAICFLRTRSTKYPSPTAASSASTCTCIAGCSRESKASRLARRSTWRISFPGTTAAVRCESSRASSPPPLNRTTVACTRCALWRTSTGTARSKAPIRQTLCPKRISLRVACRWRRLVIDSGCPQRFRRA